MKEFIAIKTKIIGKFQSTITFESILVYLKLGLLKKISKKLKATLVTKILFPGNKKYNSTSNLRYKMQNPKKKK